MPLDTLPAFGSTPSVRHDPSLDQIERDAAGHFAPLLRADLASLPATPAAMILLVDLTLDLKQASARLIPAEAARAQLRAGETAWSWVVQGVPRSATQRGSLALRLASAAAIAWRQHCQIQRLGLLAA